MKLPFLHKMRVLWVEGIGTSIHPIDYSYEEDIWVVVLLGNPRDVAIKVARNRARKSINYSCDILNPRFNCNCVSSWYLEYNLDLYGKFKHFMWKLTRKFKNIGFGI